MTAAPDQTAAPDPIAGSALVAAPALLGATISGKGVTVRITEVEAYMGDEDPGSHAYRGLRPANRRLFGPPGTLYAYRSYGIHTCMNVVCGPDGVASGVLLRAGEVVEGVDTARGRRGEVPPSALARGPGNFGSALGAVLGEDDGTSVLDGSGPYSLRLPPRPQDGGAVAPLRVERGPRTGVSGVAGGSAYPWRFWLAGDPTVSAYRRHPKAEDGIRR